MGYAPMLACLCRVDAEPAVPEELQALEDQVRERPGRDEVKYLLLEWGDDNLRRLTDNLHVPSAAGQVPNDHHEDEPASEE